MSGPNSDVVCLLMGSFIARWGILLGAGLLFLLFTYARKLRGAETRDLRTFAADCSKQALQQAFGGLLMAAVGVHLASERGLDSLAWYGGEYPYELVLTTAFTAVFRRLSEAMARRCYEAGASSAARAERYCLPLLHMGRYGPSEAEPFRCDWYAMQLVQAVLFIGVPARLLSVGLILAAAALPAAANPVRAVATAYFHSGLGCTARTALTLYLVPLAGDAVQFAVVDAIQRARASAADDRRRLLQLGGRV